MMTRGTKRLAESASSAPDSNDSALQSKRVMAAPNFDVHRAESPNNHTVEAPQLDAQRAQSCHLHVRALNTQYASWVQSQLKNHPDELWQDGAQDYINHASHIMEKFSDVVAWLRANASKAEGVSITSYLTIKRSPQGAFAKPEAAEDLDEDNEAEKQSSPSLKRTEEKGIVVVHEVKCKLYVQPENPAEKGWKDFGVGQLSIRCKEGAGKATRESKPTILIRNDVGKILLNALIYPGIKTSVQKNTITAVFHTVGGGEAAVARTYLLRTKTGEETAKLAAAIKEYAPEQ
ncbi:unnamed protein product [Spirodela intermedia]|uniref:RanBD1 domain-containing protein n=1 Tax=Spirodela intermedia TaxID=51605 RepID=A0A7I8JVG2_SPIIN|nr:unnamed protein product [Spirodela intermedia]CAA6673623.1 unnamed protein product [Spirodela intermedia]